MKLSKAIRTSHADLSAVNLKFLEFVSRQSDCLERSNFLELTQAELDSDIRMQSWPTFVSSKVLGEAAHAAVELCRLAKSIPQRVFGSDLGKISEFYGIDPMHTQMIAPMLSSPKKLSGLLARPDLIRSSSGFKCLECNLAGNLGGWEPSSFGKTFLDQQWIARFLKEIGIVPQVKPVLRSILTHLVRQMLGRFRQKEVNLVVAAPSPEIRLEKISQIVQDEYARILAKAGLQGVLIESDMTDLEEKDALIFCRGKRIHALVERFTNAAQTSIYKSWVWGKLLLFNGPVTPILTDKRNLALLWELQDSGLFNAQESEVIKTFLPPTYRVSSDRMHAKSHPPITDQGILSRRESWVLKSATGMGGEEVILGCETDSDTWDQAMSKALETGDWVIQERVDSPFHLYQSKTSGVTLHRLLWGCFVLGETFGGCWTRVSPQSSSQVVNAMKGAEEGVVFEMDE